VAIFSPSQHQSNSPQNHEQTRGKQFILIHCFLCYNSIVKKHQTADALSHPLLFCPLFSTTASALMMLAGFVLCEMCASVCRVNIYNYKKILFYKKYTFDPAHMAHTPKSPCFFAEADC